MDWWSLAPYLVPAFVAVIAIIVLVGAARSRAARRSRRPRQGASSSVDPFYLDSSHMGEPQAGSPARGNMRFDSGATAGGKSRRARR
ncbi:MAG: hypothetical protein E6H78_07425 [Betaproteobacteria bacterium]|nr:MAG: hypothetical protein E6H78_07425 [Betaproteobacteria bacterium]